MKNLKNIKYLFVFSLLLTCAFYSCAQSRTEKNTEKPLVVFVTGDHEYSSEATMPLLAAELEKNYGFRTIVLKSSPDHNSEENIPGLEALKDADMAVFFLRWRRLPADQVEHIEDYLKTGKPVVGFRTTTHAFNYPKGHELEKWNAFGEVAFNSPPGWGGNAGHTHYGHESTTDVTVIPEARKDPILTGVDQKFHAKSWLYTVLPDYPSNASKWLLMGHSVNPNKADAIDHPVAWTGKNSYGGKVFMTTLGHPEDFDQEPFQRLVINAIHWSAGKPVPKKWAGKITMNVPYRHPAN
jgi:type 1 glutamine amidotransferase